jgi:hypothetical protein
MCVLAATAWLWGFSCVSNAALGTPPLRFINFATLSLGRTLDIMGHGGTARVYRGKCRVRGR